MANTCDLPFRLEPQFVERLWGAPADSEELVTFFTFKQSITAGGHSRRIGEVWLTGNDNLIANGPWTGKTLRELTSTCGRSLFGAGSLLSHPTGQPVFPLLVKFLFTTDKLSVQVHPPDDAARSLGSWGKTEMWYILRVEPGSRLAVGFREEAPREILNDAAKLRDAATTGAIEQMLDWQEVRAGEAYFVPAGTVHAIGSGITLCEIQQYSDITYRLYDYNRAGLDGKPRALHVDQAVKVIDPRSPGGRTVPHHLTDGSGPRHLLAACPYFATERWELRDAVQRSTANHLELWIVLQGSAVIQAAGASQSVQAGQVVVIPADAGSFLVQPHGMSVFLRTYPPDWEREIMEPLRSSNISPEQLRRTCYPSPVADKGVAT